MELQIILAFFLWKSFDIYLIISHHSLNFLITTDSPGFQKRLYCHDKLERIQLKEEMRHMFFHGGRFSLCFIFVLKILKHNWFCHVQIYYLPIYFFSWWIKILLFKFGLTCFTIFRPKHFTFKIAEIATLNAFYGYSSFS